MSQAPASAPPRAADSPLRAAFAAQRKLILHVAWLSFVTGSLLLIPSWYMFEVYGRVINSRSHVTLAWLVVMVTSVYVLVEVLDLVRQHLLQSASADFEKRLRLRLFGAAFDANLRHRPGGTAQPFTDLKTLRDFIASPVITAAMDLPVAVLCMLVLFALGPMLGAVAVVGAGVQVWLGWLTERRTMPLLGQATTASIDATNHLNAVLRNAQVIEAMGMQQHVFGRWHAKQRRFLARQAEASDYAGLTSAAAKLLQTLQGSILLGAGAWIALHGGLWGGVGMVIVASIFGGKALQPLAQLVQNWRLVINARDARDRLRNLLAGHDEPEPGMPLPAPQGHLTVEAVTAVAPGQTTQILRNVSFAAKPGELTLIVGPTAAGKSTLARLLVGVWPCLVGKVRLDGADVHTWNKAELGPCIGYLPQNVELFEGTVAENVARFGPVDEAAVRDALERVGLTEAVEQLPAGLDERIGDDGAVLSGGQRQRLGLARALYGKPRLVVLDEPNSSLDQAGDQALLALLQRLKSEGVTVLAITHRNTLMPATDKIVLMREGQVAMHGPRDDVLAALAKANEQHRAQQQAAPQPPGPARLAVNPLPAAGGLQ
ncbi:MAG: type I secretion system permease/ATPase [Burkholderiales bacterium]|nr:type I secretion system permease/ATPase [Burkholderiales bacterium]